VVRSRTGIDRTLLHEREEVIRRTRRAGPPKEVQPMCRRAYSQRGGRRL